MSNIVKNQHYVPQFYLNYFANKKRNIFVYDKFELKSFPSNAKGIASEGYFYDIIKGETQTIEKILNAKYESAFSNFLPFFIEELNSHNDFELKKREKEEIASFLSYQYIRTKRFREESVRLFTSSEIYFSDPHFPPLVGHMFVLTDPKIQEGLYNNLMNNYYWIIAKNITGDLFYTSDHPFVQKESLQEIHEKHQLEFADFTLLSDEASFPLTPEFNITFYKKCRNVEYLSGYDGKMVECDKDNVDWYNNMQVMKSYRQVYSQNNDFSFVVKLEEIRRKHLISEGTSPEMLKVPKLKNDERD